MGELMSRTVPAATISIPNHVTLIRYSSCLLYQSVLLLLYISFMLGYEIFSFWYHM